MKHLTLKHNENRLLLDFSFVCVVWMDARCTGAQGGQNGALDTLALESEASVSHLKWVLGTKPGSSAHSTLNRWAMSPIPVLFIDIGSLYVVQAGLELLGSQETIGMSHCTQLLLFLFSALNKLNPSTSNNLLQQKANNQFICCYIHILIQAKCIHEYTNK